MLHRAHRRLVRCFALAWLLQPLAARAVVAQDERPPRLVIRIEDVGAVARDMSPRLRALGQETAAVAAGRDAALQWSNPAIAYDREQSPTSHEWQVTLHKRLSRPLKASDVREAWTTRAEAAALAEVQSTQEFVAGMKAGYARIQLLGEYRERLATLAGVVVMAGEVAGSRHAAGVMSGLERRLVDLAAYTIEAAARRAAQAHRLELAAWRAAMGVPAGTELDLATSMGYRPADLLSGTAYAGLPAHGAGARSRESLARALGAQAAAARTGLLPGLDLYGGFKRFAGGDDGFVAGAALELPLFDRGTAEARRLDAERRIVEFELAADIALREGEAAGLVAALREAQPVLAAFAERHARQPALIESLLAAYREGTLALAELLAAVEVESSAMQAYHDELTAYYVNNFRLEAVTGIAPIGFTP